MADIPPDSALDRQRHLKYWQRCFRTILPAPYIGHDSTRIALIFFIVAAFDLLSPDSSSGKPQNLSQDDRRKVRSWILSLQHPGGGFCGSHTHALPNDMCCFVDPESKTTKTQHISATNLAATYFALLVLAMVADRDGANAFEGVNRKAILRGLKKLQRPDGSFGEVLLDDGTVEGGYDMRHCYLASAVRWCLRGDIEEGDEAWVEDIDVDALVEHIRRGQTYAGGMAESSQHEAHAGYAYCAIGALKMLDRPFDASAPHKDELLARGVPHIENLIKALTYHQFVYLGNQDDEEDLMNFLLPESLEELSLEENTHFVGFNGRCNKVADTCYTWWVGGTLAMLSPETLVATTPARNFLLHKTEHIIGGFSKWPGGPPDVLHAYLGLAALDIMGEPGMKPFDAALCVSTETTDKIQKARSRVVAADRTRRDWAEKSRAGAADFWKGKEAVWPSSGLDEATTQSLRTALQSLA